MVNGVHVFVKPPLANTVQNVNDVHKSEGQMHDIVIRGGVVVDGTGAEAREAHVAIDGATITAVAGDVGAGRREVDARGLVVTPGFVDIHTHYDAQATWDPYLTPSGFHGCTTVVMGSCGVGFAPAAPDRHEWLIGLMEGVEDIPGSALVEGIRWGWESFPEYLDALARMPRALDVGAQIAHGPLRAYVMGERGAKNERATSDDIARMKALVKEALLAGALGFSTSRTSLHRAIDGELVPGTTAHEDELMGIGDALAEAGRGVFQAALEHKDVPAELAWLRRLAARIRRPVTFNLSQIDDAPDLWRRSVQILDEAAAHGEPLFAQVAGRSIGICMSMQATAHPFVLTPAYLEVVGEPWSERQALLRDPERRRRLLDEEPLVLEGPQAGLARLVTTRVDKMFVMDDAFDYEPAPSQSLEAIAVARDVAARPRPRRAPRGAAPLLSAVQLRARQPRRPRRAARASPHGARALRRGRALRRHLRRRHAHVHAHALGARSSSRSAHET
jgi:N-acyl-D-aspartate/D-glutamate deacylase